MENFQDLNISFKKSSDNELNIGQYENCSFHNLDLSNQNFSFYKFVDCSFVDCNFSLSIFSDTLFNGITLTNCKMIGVKFDYFKKFGLSINFQNCNLNDTIFYGMDLRKIKFHHCTLHGCDFSNANLDSLVLSECDLLDAKFDNSTLTKTNFSTAYNFIIDPTKNNIRKATFSQAGISGLLRNYDIKIIP